MFYIFVMLYPEIDVATSGHRFQSQITESFILQLKTMTDMTGR